ncbi:MAG: V-type ATP synthase subunit I [Bacteroidaceae bacterium]|nr:V-type ATP synthase subunit I [Bacteroidaceae bacterium]
MISKMKKLTMLIYHKEYQEILQTLRAAGVVHIEQGSADISEVPQIQTLQSECTSYLRLVHSLEKLAPESTEAAASSEGAQETMARVEELNATLERLKQALQAAEKDASAMNVWGDFDTTLIDKLAAEGYALNFFQTSVKSFDSEWSEQYNAVIIKQAGSRVYFVTVTDGLVPEIDAEHIILPKNRLADITVEVERLNVEIKLVGEQLASLAGNKLPVLRAKLKELNAQLDFSRVEYSGEKVTGDKLLLLQGWVPEEEADALVKILDAEPVFYELRTPTPDDNVPIRFKNNAFFRLFEPICELYMLPKYNEIDLTPFFAPFYMIFFGLCLGDMGYGLVMSVAMIAVLLSGKFKSMRGYFNLVLTLGVSTMLCGSLTGTFFGFNIYDWNVPLLDWWRDNVSLAYINPETGQMNDPNPSLFNLSLILGGVQILFGMIIKAANQTIQLGFKYALSTIGWLVILLTLVAMFVIPGMNTTVAYVLLGIGAVGVFLLNSPGKNPLLNIGLGLWDSYNMATGLLGDILSYVRLFALGLSGGILAMVFNSLAMGLSPDVPVLGTVVTVLIFVIGHFINMFMNVLGAMVHPMRLTFVEFFKNSGYEGGGAAYKPFK